MSGIIAVKKGTISYRTVSSVQDMAVDEVAFTGVWRVGVDGYTPLMVAVANAAPRAMTQQEIDAVPAQIAAAKAAAVKAAAAAIFTSAKTLDDLRLAMFAFMQLVLDDRNLMADKVNAIGSALTVNGTTLAAIRTAVLAIPGGLAPKYTQQQLVDAIVAKINAAA